jgi:hypothetical protein
VKPKTDIAKTEVVEPTKTEIVEKVYTTILKTEAKRYGSPEAFVKKYTLDSQLPPSTTHLQEIPLTQIK